MLLVVVVVKVGYLQHHLFCFHVRGTSILCRHEQSKISARCLYVQFAGVNGVTGATAETTTYDRIFSTMKAMEAIMAGKGITDPSKVTAVMLANAYKKVWNVIVQPFLASLIFCTRCLGWWKKIWTYLNLPISEKVQVGTLAIGTKTLHGIKRVPQWSGIGSTV